MSASSGPSASGAVPAWWPPEQPWHRPKEPNNWQIARAEGRQRVERAGERHLMPTAADCDFSAKRVARIRESLKIMPARMAVL